MDGVLLHRLILYLPRKDKCFTSIVLKIERLETLVLALTTYMSCDLLADIFQYLKNLCKTKIVTHREER